MFQGTEDQGTELYMRALSSFESTCENYEGGAFESVTLTGVAHSYQELSKSFIQSAGAGNKISELVAEGFKVVSNKMDNCVP